MKKFIERLADPAPLLYDGGFGSQLFARGIELVNSTLANESHPDAVIDIHSDYIAAGAEIIGTNTFVASPLHLDMAGKKPSEAGAIALLATQNAKAAVERSGKEVYIAGSIGPSPGAIEADAGSTDFGIANHLVREAHERIIEALAEGGVDFFVLETMFSATEAAIAVDIARRTGLPIAVNLTYKYTKDRKTGQIIYKTDWGHSAASLVKILADGEFSQGDNLLDSVQIFGLNCGAETRRAEHTGMPYAVAGIQQMQEALDAIQLSGKYFMAYPNAGMPLLDKEHRTYYSQSPEEMASHLPTLLKAGASLVGGCCGTTPQHIQAFRKTLDVN